MRFRVSRTLTRAAALRSPVVSRECLRLSCNMVVVEESVAGEYLWTDAVKKPRAY